MAESQTTDEVRMDLRALRLKPGMFLQLLAPGRPACEAQFCAAIGGKGIMVVPLAEADPASILPPGSLRQVRGFTGQYEFRFDAPVIQSFEQPFAYTLLAYPEAVMARRVRSAQRIPTALPAYVRKPGHAKPLPGIVVDLSPAGAMVGSAEAIGEIGESVRLSFSVLVDNRHIDMALDATLCHGARSDSADGYRTGLAFKTISRNDRLVLQCFTLAHDAAA